MVKVEVVYCSADQQWLIPLTLPLNSTVKTAIIESKLLESQPQLTLENIIVGIFSRRVALDTPLTKGDRVEIYRDLLIDPKQARRKRAK